MLVMCNTIQINPHYVFQPTFLDKIPFFSKWQRRSMIIIIIIIVIIIIRIIITVLYAYYFVGC